MDVSSIERRLVGKSHQPTVASYFYADFNSDHCIRCFGHKGTDFSDEEASHIQDGAWRCQEGAVVNVTNVNNPAPELKQGIYGKIASDRATVGVFKEVMPNIDISLGAGQDFDEDVVVESEVRFKF